MRLARGRSPARPVRHAIGPARIASPPPPAPDSPVPNHVTDPSGTRLAVCQSGPRPLRSPIGTLPIAFRTAWYLALPSRQGPRRSATVLWSRWLDLGTPLVKPTFPPHRTAILPRSGGCSCRSARRDGTRSPRSVGSRCGPSCRPLLAGLRVLQRRGAGVDHRRRLAKPRCHRLTTRPARDSGHLPLLFGEPAGFGCWLGFSCLPRFPWFLSQVMFVPGVPLFGFLMSASWLGLATGLSCPSLLRTGELRRVPT